MADPGLSVLTSYAAKARKALPAAVKISNQSQSSWFGFGSPSPADSGDFEAKALKGKGNTGFLIHRVLTSALNSNDDETTKVNNSIPVFLALLSVLSGAEKKRRKAAASPNPAASPSSPPPSDSADDKIKSLCTLYKMCESDGELLSSSFSPSSSSSSSTPAPAPSGAAPSFSLVKSLCLAIDTASKLLAHGSLDGRYIQDENKVAKPLLAVMTELICGVSLSSSDEIELCVLKYLLTATCRPHISDAFALRETYLLQAVRVVYNVFLCTTSNPNRITARATLEQMIASVFARMEFYEKHNPDALPPPPPPPSTANGNGNGNGNDKEKEQQFKSPNHRDAFLVFRSLCKLSMKAIPDQADLGYTYTGAMTDSSKLTPSKPAEIAALNKAAGKQALDPALASNGQHLATAASPSLGSPALESKILALELLLSVLNNAGRALVEGDRFEFAIRHYLCVSLLKNCTSDVTKVVSLSLRLFVPIIRHFRDNLKSEIEVFITNIFFVIIQSPNSSPDHKSLVISLFEQICADPQTLAEIFLNYDCDLSAVDLFHRIVAALERAAKTTHDDPNLPTQSIFSHSSRLVILKQTTAKLRLDAMKALVQVMVSLHACIEESENAIGSPIVASSYSADSLDTAGTPQSNDHYENGHQNGHVNDDVPSEPSSRPTQASIVEIYDSKKRLKQQLEEVVLRFNNSPKQGLKYAGQCGLVDSANPEDVARYLIENKDRFDKTIIGEYLGREREYLDGFCFQVLHHYTDQLDFTGLVFDDAIRHFLAGFRLPGEAQKIDRIMEKFSERFSLQNPDVFPTADVAFILAFSVIMLNTDLHNPNLKEERRMTKEGFIRNNRGISTNGGDLPKEMLEGIFDRIQKKQISLKEDDLARQKIEKAPTDNPRYGMFADQYLEFDKTREAEFVKERDAMVRNTEHFFRQKRKRRGDSEFIKTDTAGLRDEYVLPMFDVTWAPALSVFSIAMESANGLDKLSAASTEIERKFMEDNAAAAMKVCLQGFRLGVRIAGQCGLELAREAFILALANFTTLGTGKLMEERHLNCVICLFEIALEEGEGLGSTWEHLFKVVSEVNRLQQVFERVQTDESVLVGSGTRRGSGGNVDAEDEKGGETELSEKAIDDVNAQLVSDAISGSLIDKIFITSTNLSEKAVYDFVLQLCRVSRMEISGYGGSLGSSKNEVKAGGDQYGRRRRFGAGIGVRSRIGNQQPVIFCLQKLVEVAHHNLESRGRLVWDSLWGLMGAHFESTALHTNAAVAMYAVDSLKQLTLKFLRREELSEFEFQRKFMRPYENIMEKSQLDSTRELVLNCIDTMVKVNGDSMRSGWRTVMAVLKLAGKDKMESISSTGFVVLKGFAEEILSGSEESNMAEFGVDVIVGLIGYAGGVDMERSVEAVGLITKMAKWLGSLSGEGMGMGMAALVRRSSGGIVPGEVGIENGMECWFPILGGLLDLVGDEREDIRVRGLTSFVSIVDEYFYSDKVVKDPVAALRQIFNCILLPVFETYGSGVGAGGSDLPDGIGGREANGEEKNGWLDTSFDMTIDASICLMAKADEVFEDGILLNDMFSIFFGCINSSSIGLKCKGLGRLKDFIIVERKGAVSEEEWDCVAGSLSACLRASFEGGISRAGSLNLSEEVEGEAESEAGKKKNSDVDSSGIVGVVAAHNIGALLCTLENIPVSVYKILIGALHEAVKIYEVMEEKGLGRAGGVSNVEPAEACLYCRKTMVEVLLRLARVGEDGDGDVQDMLMSITKDLCSAYVGKDAEAQAGGEVGAEDLSQLKGLVVILLEGYRDFEDDLLLKNIWLLPILSKLIECSDKGIRVTVHVIVSRLFDGPLSDLLKMSEAGAGK
ncbi:hypothetical protein TrCOL_g9786 [Triparma columacea]|uniref:SEC7 domain-containing protein n=1 Tax=Triparma columacea TaxID=722753 RepID=A0A9W7GDS2_9STRA|nr:hypothetical protein TrCOL_g9786 [Triparma columacea]